MFDPNQNMMLQDINDMMFKHKGLKGKKPSRGNGVNKTSNQGADLKGEGEQKSYLSGNNQQNYNLQKDDLD